MTRMSDLHTADDAGSRGYTVARALHDYAAPVVRLVPLVFVAGCIFPPNLGVEQQDAGVNSPPSVLSARTDQTELPEPGPVDIEVGQMSPLNLTLLDTDITDKLYVRVFVDYSTANRTAPRSLCPAATSGEATRTATCPMQGICLASDVRSTDMPHIMQIMVFDREPLDETGQQPLFQAMPLGGLSTDRVYQLNCKNPTP